MNPVRIIEHVPYRRHVISFVTAEGKRRRVVRWSPCTTPGQCGPWIDEEFAREWGGVVKPGSNVYFRQVDP